MGLTVNQNVMLPASLVTTATTPNQQILTYTVPDGMTFYLSVFQANVKLSTFAITATDFGPMSFRVNGVTKISAMSQGPGTDNSPIYFEFSEALPFQAGDVITVVCTPAAATSFTWECNTIGYLK